jgi:beta-galactosidase
MTEWSAVYLGPESYRMETEDYRSAIAKSYKKDFDYGNWDGEYRPVLIHEPAFQALEALFIGNTWRSWRTWGDTGGMIAWDNDVIGWGITAGAKQLSPPKTSAPFAPGRLGVYNLHQSNQFLYGAWNSLPAGRVMTEVNAPALAWIAGPSVKVTAKDHNFYANTWVEKQITIINDTRDPEPYNVTYSVRVGNQIVLHEVRKGEIDVGKNSFIPLRFKTPLVSAKTDGKIELSAQIGSEKQTDRFAFRVFVAQNVSLTKPPVLVWDSEGATTEMLTRLGFAAQKWEGEPLAGRVLVIGRHALDRGDEFTGDINALVSGGGRVVIMGQNPEWLRNSVGFQVAPHVARRLFPVQLDHPIVAGLDSADLSDWQGRGTLIPETANVELDNWKKDLSYGWRWGNQGSVSSAMIEKPHFGSWQPILEGEFDLAYSPLMELHSGTGLLIWCTLDLEGRHATDPVADLLMTRIINYATSENHSKTERVTYYMGGPKGEALLKNLGAVFTKVSSVPLVPGQILVVGKAAPSTAGIEDYLKTGGTLLFLGGDPETLPFNFKTVINQNFTGSLNVPRWPECQGLSSSDLRLRSGVQAKLLASGPGEIGADGLLGRYSLGKGKAFIVMLTADDLPVSDKAYFRLSEWRYTRMLSQILGNLGVPLEADKKNFQFRSPFSAIPLTGIWKCKIEVAVPIPSSGQFSQDPGNKGYAMGSADPQTNDRDWEETHLPGDWKLNGGKWTSFDGAVWFRKTVTIPPEWQGKDLELELGAINTFDTAYFNNVQVGGMGPEVPDSYQTLREYHIPASLVHVGSNVIAVRVFDHYSGAGFVGPDKAMKLDVIRSPMELGRDGFYSPDINEDHGMGNGPYLYTRW